MVKAAFAFYVHVHAFSILKLGFETPGLGKPSYRSKIPYGKI